LKGKRYPPGTRPGEKEKIHGKKEEKIVVRGASRK